MEWWGWTTWGITAAIALGALVLGIRAEHRASRYTPLWVLRDGVPLSAYNRTGEDATNVTFELDGATLVNGHRKFALIKADESFKIVARPDDRDAGFRITVIWTRPLNDRVYRWPETRRDRWNRWRHEAKAHGYTHANL